MKQFYFLLLTMFVLTTSLLKAQNSDRWLENWVNAIDLSKDRTNYPKAIENYSSAIQTFSLNQPIVLLNLMNERGNLYLKMGDFNNAIKDFSFVLNHPQANREQKIEALWKRSIAYVASGNIKEFQEDTNQLEKLEPAVTPIEDNKNYTIYKLAPRMLQDPNSREKFIDMLILRKEIKSDKEVSFASSGLAIIKKTQ